jgi:hypothetical protein
VATDEHHDVLLEPPHVWIIVVNGGRGRLLKCGRVPPGRLHVDEVSAVEHEPELHEHVRPSPRSGKSGNTYASGGHEDEYRIPIQLFAPPRFLGELRKLYGPLLTRRIEEHQADLTHLSAAALAKHPAVAALLPG